MAKRQRHSVSHEDFVAAWTKAENIGEVEKATGMSVAGIRARSIVLKKAGVKLKAFERKRQAAPDVDALNALIKKLSK